MEKLVITGGRQLHGTIKVSGAKNAVLPILAASLLGNGPSTIEDVPQLADVATMQAVLTRLGANIQQNGSSLVVEAKTLCSHEAPYDYVRRMRASLLVMGPLLARLGQTRISMPGGCAIGTRPIDLHLKGFAALGANIITGQGYVEAVTKQLIGNRIYLDFPSVGATENIMIAATVAKGLTLIENAAEEPEIQDLANYLNCMGAKIQGAGTKVIKIEGVDELYGARHQVIPDRIEAGTFLVAAAITSGDVLLENVVVEHLRPIIAKLAESGAYVEERAASIRIVGKPKINKFTIKTLPYPGFPTDMQAQMMALATIAHGASIFTETVFENRFMHIDELRRLGAIIQVQGDTAIVEGVGKLTGAPVKATDLRAGAALVLAGLAARGTTEISNIHHLDRGYEQLENKLRGVGADIHRVPAGLYASQ